MPFRWMSPPPRSEATPGFRFSRIREEPAARGDEKELDAAACHDVDLHCNITACKT